MNITHLPLFRSIMYKLNVMYTLNPLLIKYSYTQNTHTHTHWGKREARANFTVTMTLMANTKSTGVRSSCQNMRATGVHLVDSWTALQYAHRSRGKCRSQSHGWLRQQAGWPEYG